MPPRRCARRARLHPAIGSLLLACASLPSAGCGDADETRAAAGPSGPPDVVRRDVAVVAPQLVGTGGVGYRFGSAFPGAAAPSGLVKVGPDTKGPWGTVAFLHYSGYWFGDDVIQGFSHLHMHGTGATDYGVLALMPTDAFDASRTTAEGYESPFDKSTESTSPGRYGVTLARGGVRVELAALPRSAHHHYTFPDGAATGHVVLDLDHHLSGGTIDAAELAIDAEARTVTGRLHHVGGMSGGFGGYWLSFAIRSRSPFAGAQVWANGEAPAPGEAASGTGVGAALAFDLAASPGPIELGVGLSMVSVEGALANLDAELPSLDGDAAAGATEALWAPLLDRVRVTGGLEEDRVKMQAALYHLFLMPTVQSDVTGSYTGFDGAVHQADDFTFLSDMSLWDTYRTLHPLYDLIAPELSRDVVRSLHEMAKDGGFFPKWPLGPGEAGTMLGSSAEVVVADAFVKGVTDFDAEGAYAILRAAAMDEVAPPGGRGGRGDVEPYMQYGYVPSSRDRSVSMTTEYANDDLALAALAEGLGHADDAAHLRERATGYRALYDPETGFLWARDESGAFSTDHADPTRQTEEFAEANAWQSLWMVAEDIPGLAEVAGGREALAAKLEELFVKGREEYESLDWDNEITSGSIRSYYWAANEPDLHAAFAFAQLGRPDLTQRWSAWARAYLYNAGADGLPGNDDGGTMSAWFVWAALGLYPIPATDRYIVGTPLFPHAEIDVRDGTFTIDAPGVSDTMLYVQSATLDGAPLTRAELRHAELKPGGALVLAMGASPSAWGRDSAE
jgi:predicted alpha-1,2-mannosidase